MKALYFDLDGTLLHLTREYDDILSDTFRAVENESRKEWIDAYNDAFFELFDNCDSEPYRRAFATVSDDPDALVDALREREVNACQPPESAHSRLATLAETYELGVLTNGVRDWQMHKLRTHGLYTYFDVVVTSYEADAHKPAREPFLLAEKRLRADDYAMIGDADADIEGAKRAGWTTYRYGGEGFDELPDALDWE